jgi:hypothetical protein
LDAKLRLAGDLIYTLWPQVSLGAQYKRLHDFDLPNKVGAGDASGVGVYVAASKRIIAGMAGRTTSC